jgi:5-(carboxyamino)imidazole ribonucleotide mutase
MNAKNPKASDQQALVAIVMGSKTDWEVLSAAADLLRELGIPYEARVLSAHRTPEEALAYARAAESRGLKAIIAGAGGAAALPGAIAAATLVPVLGVPIPMAVLSGLDSLLSMVQMPKGVPVGTLAIGKPGAANAAIFAAEMIGLSDAAVRDRLRAWRAARRDEVLAQTLP